MVESPGFCHNLHRLSPGNVTVGREACTTHTGGHITWFCRRCSDVTYSPPTDPLCTVVNGPAEIRNSYTGSAVTGNT